MSKFDGQGNITDDRLKEQLSAYMRGFTEFVATMKP
jgi:hypothetical protein